jgi:acrylyl-CoA reductase (NADPH)
MEGEMSGKVFRALTITEVGKKKFERAVEERTTDTLPVGEVLIRVAYSSLNYKDALSATGNPGVTRKYPHTPGIDAAGVVEESTSDTFKPGEKVIVTSYDLGMNTSGGFGQYIRVPADWVVRLPEGLTLEEAMIYGTAGFTAAMSVFAVEKAVGPEMGEILVTGATGGVGSLAVAILAKLGYSVAAVSGKPDAADFLKKIGAAKVLSREEITENNERPLLKPMWGGVVDTVGGEILAAAIKSTNPQGVITCCGNVASPDLAINVFPFILRGVSLVGIDSQNCPMQHRAELWARLANEWKIEVLQSLCREVSLEGLGAEIDLILKGGQKGRVIVNLEK